MSELSEEARALLAREAPLDEPTPSELEHGRAQIFATLGLPLPQVSAPPVDGEAVHTATNAGGTPNAVSTEVSTATSPSGAGLGLSTKLAIATLLVGTAVGVVAYRAMRAETPVPPPADVAAPPVAPTPPQPIEPPPVVAPDPNDTATPPSVEPTVQPTLPRPRVPEAPEPNDALASESMLIAAAEAQLRAGHAAEALSLYDRYLREHPSGALRHESVTGRIAALCRLGRIDAGRAELERFAAQSPRSPSLPRLRAACGVDTPPEVEVEP